jgi:peptide deformylase
MPSSFLAHPKIGKAVIFGCDMRNFSQPPKRDHLKFLDEHFVEEYMAIREIVTTPNPVLRKKARKVTDFGPETQELIDDMVETMRVAPGVGLAAPQVDVSQRVVVVEYGDDEDEEAPKKLFTLVNPEIIRYSPETILGNEGCLSVLGFQGEVERSLEVTVKALNRREKPVKIKAKDWLARIFQHEIDHLDGVLFVDRATNVWKAEENPSQVAPVD